MTCTVRVLVGAEMDDGSSVVWRLDAAYGSLSINEHFKLMFFARGSEGPHRPTFDLHITGSGERIDAEGHALDILSLPLPEEAP